MFYVESASNELNHVQNGAKMNEISMLKDWWKLRWLKIWNKCRTHTRARVAWAQWCAHSVLREPLESYLSILTMCAWYSTRAVRTKWRISWRSTLGYMRKTR